MQYQCRFLLRAIRMPVSISFFSSRVWPIVPPRPPSLSLRGAAARGVGPLSPRGMCERLQPFLFPPAIVVRCPLLFSCRPCFLSRDAALRPSSSAQCRPFHGCCWAGVLIPSEEASRMKPAASFYFSLIPPHLSPLVSPCIATLAGVYTGAPCPSRRSPTPPLPLLAGLAGLAPWAAL